MTGNKYIYCVLAMALIALQGCKKTAHVDEEQSMANADSVSTEIYVDTLRLQEQTFHLVDHHLPIRRVYPLVDVACSPNR